MLFQRYGLFIFFFWLTPPLFATQPLILAASHYPLAFLARQTLKDRVQVIQLTPNGAEPHEYSPKPRDIILLQQAKLVLFHGPSMEPWIEKQALELQQQGVKLLRLEDFFKTLKEKKPPAHPQDRENYDPHFWLDPLQAQKVTSFIEKAAIDLLPNQKADISNQAITLRKKLAQLHQSYEKGLAQCASRILLSEHAAFGHLARRYNLETLSLRGLSPHSLPSPKKMALLVQEIRRRKVTSIFFETTSAPKFIEILARETGAQKLELHPLGRISQKRLTKGENYFTLMRFNLQQLRRGLRCK